MIWSRNGYDPPPTRRQYDRLLSAIDELSETMADQAERIFDLQVQVNDLAGQIGTVEECLGWFEAGTS